MSARDISDEEVEAGLIRDGFLSSAIDDFRHVITAAHPQWFAFARRLNQAALGTWLAHPITKSGVCINDAEPIAIRLFARAINSFQGTMMLLKRGMTIEAGNLARSVYEATFWLGYLSKSGDEAATEFLVDESLGRRGMLMAMGKLPLDDPTLEAAVRSQLSEIEEVLGRRKQSLGIPTIADRGGLGGYYAYYRLLSGNSGHASATSVLHYLQIFEDGTAGHAIGPDITGVPEKSLLACQALLLATDAFLALTDDGNRPAMLPLVNEFLALSDTADFPTSRFRRP